MKTPHSEFVGEICRTLSRLEQTELIRKYSKVINYYASHIYCGDAGSSGYIRYNEFKEGDDDFLKETEISELKMWLKDYPWYVFSLVVGLSKGDENLAWALAYG